MAEAIQKRRAGRPKKPVVEDAVVLVNEPTEPPSVREKGVRKASTKASAKPATPEDMKPATTRKPRASTTKSNANIDDGKKTLTKTASKPTSKRAKTSTSDDTSTPTETKSPKNAKSATASAPSLSPVLENTAATHPANTTVEPIQSSSEPQVLAAPSAHTPSAQISPHIQSTPENPHTASAKDSRFLSSFLNDPEPAPSGGIHISLEEERELQQNEVPPPHSSKARAAAAHRARIEQQQQQQHQAQSVPAQATPLENPVASGENPAQDQIDTMMRIRDYGAQSFAALRAHVPSSTNANSKSVDVNSHTRTASVTNTSKPASKANTPGSKPAPNAKVNSSSETNTTTNTTIPHPAKSPVSQKAPLPPPLAPTAPLLPQAESPARTSASTTHRVHQAKANPQPPPPPPSASLPSSSSSSRPRNPPTPYQRPPPLRPTQLPLSELRKTPEFRRLSRRYTSLFIAIPILIVTSGELWRRYEVQRAERIAQGLVGAEQNGLRGAVDGFMARGGSVKRWGGGGGGEGNEGGMRNGGI